MRRAITTPVAAAELDGVRRKLDALAHRPMADIALRDAVRCTGQPFSDPGGAPIDVDAARLEGWRLAGHRRGRTALAIVGPASLTEPVAGSIQAGPAWPSDDAAASPSAAGASATPETRDSLSVYGTPDLPAGAARATLAFHVPSRERAILAAETLGNPNGALVARLAGLEAPPRVRDVTATAHASGGCLAVTLEFPAKEAADGASRVAGAVALARQEILAEIDEAGDAPGLGRRSAEQAGDPGEAAERAAWWTVVQARRRSPLDRTGLRGSPSP